MAEDISDICFQQGFEKAMAAIIGGGHVKSAINPRMAGATAAPFIDAEAKALGERLFHQSYRSPGVWPGLKALMLGGYGQIKGIHKLNNGPHTAADLERAFTSLGHTARPRIDLANRALPAAAALGVGIPVTAGINRMRGQQEGLDQAGIQLSQLPLGARLRYLMQPGAFTHSPSNGGQQ